MEDRYNYYEEIFHCTQEQLIKLYKAFLNEIQSGLNAHSADNTTLSSDASSLRMLDTCVKYIPSQKEKGVFYSLHFGDSEIKAIKCALDGTGKIATETVSESIRETCQTSHLTKGLLDKNCTATMLFDQLASTVAKVVKDEKESRRKLGLGFTFSFPIHQKATNSASLINWTKAFETGINTNDPVIGQDVCALLDKAFTRKNINLKTTVVTNDTVSCLIAGSFAKPKALPPCLVGVILGTGINGAYVQRDAKFYKYKGIIINTELGNFNKELPRNEIDYEIDYLSPNKGRQLCEKMVSYLYIPEITRLLVLRIFQKKAPEMAWVPFSMSSNGCRAIFNDPSKTYEVVKDEWSWQDISPEEAKIVSQIVFLVFRRSAAIAAVVIAGMCKATGCLQPAMGGVTVSINGPLYINNSNYQQLINHFLSLIFDETTSKLLHLVVVDDVGKGAAVLAATILTAEGSAP